MHDETIKDWRIVGKLGKGGMGEVWLAEQQIVKTKVAIKLLLADVSSRQADVQRFFNEAVAVSKIKHAGIVKIFDVGFSHERAYLVMELLEGETLAARIRREDKLKLGMVAELGRQIASILEATHAAGITHRDLKPDNIFMIGDRELACGERVKILDFGIAKLGEHSSGLTSSTSMGTPAYMAPEQWNNAAKADARADIYSLGCVLFEMLCGRPPFMATTMGEACSMHLTQTPPRASSLAANVPAELDDLIAAMLAKSPADRPAIPAVARVLSAIAAAHPYLAPDRGRVATAETLPSTVSGTMATLPSASVGELVRGPAIATKPTRPRRGLAVVLGALAVVAAAGIYVAISHSDSASPAKPAAAPLREPTYGLQTLATYRDPTPATSASLASESLWLAARDDFADACKQPKAPVRWCAAAEQTAGQALVVTGKLAEAEPFFQKAIALDPTWAAPHIGLHDIRSFNNDLEGALAEARTAQRLDPTSWTAVIAGARSYAHAPANDRIRDAIIEYQRALDLSPKNPLVMAELAMAYNAGGMVAEAERMGEEALAIDDTLSHVHLMKADRAIERGDGAAALALADRVIALRPKNPMGHMFRAEALDLLGKRDEAMAEFRQVLEVYGQDGRQRPDPHIDEIRAALAKNELPPRRYAPAKPAGNKPPVGGPGGGPKRHPQIGGPPAE